MAEEPAGETATAPVALEDQRCGFIAIIGAPNAGKSTLVNTLVGTKVTIVSRKVQTTRTPVRGIAVVGDSQLVFIDTPGIFQPRRRLDRAMVDAAWGGARDADYVVFVIERIGAWRATAPASSNVSLPRSARPFWFSTRSTP